VTRLSRDLRSTSGHIQRRYGSLVQEDLPEPRARRPQRHLRALPQDGAQMSSTVSPSEVIRLRSFSPWSSAAHPGKVCIGGLSEAPASLMWLARDRWRGICVAMAECRWEENGAMARYFSEQRIAKLYAGYDEVERQFRDLRDRIHSRAYQTNRGAEFARHGLSRRLDTLVRAIDQVYELLPPEQDEIPSNDTVVRASMVIQAFVMNAFGCLENIAWVLVHEKDIKGKGGAELDPKEVGLGKKFVRKKLSKEFQALLTKHQGWLPTSSAFVTRWPTAYPSTSRHTRYLSKTPISTTRSRKRNGRSQPGAIQRSTNGSKRSN
jgi:hypothetical protein